jgi:hypothetical protein
MAEGDFWNNLDSFVEKKSTSEPSKGSAGSEKVGDWLKSIENDKNKKKKSPSTQTTPSKTK